MHFAVDEDDDGSSPFGPAKKCPTNFSLSFDQPNKLKFVGHQGDNTYVCTQESQLYRDVTAQLFLVC